MVSFCAYGQNQPILVYIYDYRVAQQDVELVKDFSGLHLSTSSRGPQILTGISAQKDTINHPADQFASVAGVSMRMQKVKQKLDSVTASFSPLTPSPSLLSPHSKLRLASTLGEPPQIPLYPLPTQSGSFIPVGNPFSRTSSAGLCMNKSGHLRLHLLCSASVEGSTDFDVDASFDVDVEVDGLDTTADVDADCHTITTPYACTPISGQDIVGVLDCINYH
nr:uncharacterized protein LOC132769752 [Anolis sagrei ordinatus]